MARRNIIYLCHSCCLHDFSICKQLLYIEKHWHVCNNQYWVCVAPPIEYAWCQFKMTSSKCPYRSKHQVIILSLYIALKPCTSHKTSTACFSPAHEYTSSKILHIYGVSVVICGALLTRLAAANHHKPPPKRHKYA